MAGEANEFNKLTVSVGVAAGIGGAVGLGGGYKFYKHLEEPSQELTTGEIAPQPRDISVANEAIILADGAGIGAVALAGLVVGVRYAIYRHRRESKSDKLILDELDKQFTH